MKKVLVLNLTPRMGMLQYSSQFCNELKKYVDLRVGIADYYDEDLYDEDIKFIKIKTNPSAKDFVLNSLAFWRQIKFLREIKEFNPDIVHFIDNHPWYELYARVFKKRGYEIYVTQHDPIPHSGEKKSLQAKMAIKVNNTLRGKADKLIVLGDKLKKYVAHEYSIPALKVISAVHGNFNFMKDKYSKGMDIEENSFVFFGRIVDYKGLDILLESLPRIKKEIPSFKLIIAGPGDISKYNDLIEKYKGDIKLYNFDIPTNEIYKYIERGEFVVLPYYDATGSGVVPLSYAFSKSVIVTNVGELANAVIDKKTGLIIESGNVKELAEKIIYMLKNKEETKNMGVEGRKYSESVLGWEGIVKEIYKLI